MAVLSVEGLAAGHGGRALVRGLTFSLEAGDRVALVGPSGIGKTTVLRVLALLDDPLAGELRLGGRRPEEESPPRWRRRVVLVAQRAVFFGASVADELARPFRYASADGVAFPADEARALLDALGLPTVGASSVWDRPAHTLSEGEQQRVALVRALLLRPAVLLLDEPTSALDPDSTRNAEALLGGDERALVLVSHSAEQRARIGARALDLEPLAGATCD